MMMKFRGWMILSDGFYDYVLLSRSVNVQVPAWLSDYVRVPSLFAFKRLEAMFRDEYGFNRQKLLDFACESDGYFNLGLMHSFSSPHEMENFVIAKLQKVVDAFTGTHVLFQRDIHMMVRAYETSQEEPMAEEAPPMESDALGWIEIHILDELDQPAADIAMEIKLPDGRIRTGKTNLAGVLRYEALEEGTCEVTLVEVDKQIWKVM